MYLLAYNAELPKVLTACQCVNRNEELDLPKTFARVLCKSLDTDQHNPCRLSQELDLKQHALALLTERMAGSESAQLAAAVAELEAELAGQEEAASKARETKAGMVAAAKVCQSP